MTDEHLQEVCEIGIDIDKALSALTDQDDLTVVLMSCLSKWCQHDADKVCEITQLMNFLAKEVKEGAK